MPKKTVLGNNGGITAQPHFHQKAREIQKYGTVNHALPLELEEPVRLEMTEKLNQLLADTMTLRDLYKKSQCNFRVCWMPTKLSLGSVGNWRSAPTN